MDWFVAINDAARVDEDSSISADNPLLWRTALLVLLLRHVTRNGLDVHNKDSTLCLLHVIRLNRMANTRGVAKTSNFRPICGYISERVLDRGIVTMEDE